MTEDKTIDPLVDGVKTAVAHFGKAAFEVASGVGALFVGIAQTVTTKDPDDDAGGSPQKVEVE